jgi:hypothetical protein
MNALEIPDVPSPKQLSGTQAARVFARFGGVRLLYRAMAEASVPRDISVIYRWNLPRESGGTGGLIPTSAWPDVKVAARRAGIFLNAEDCAP